MEIIENFLIDKISLTSMANESDDNKYTTQQKVDAIKELQDISEHCKVAALNGHRRVSYTKPVGRIALNILKYKGYEFVWIGNTGEIEISGW